MSKFFDMISQSSDAVWKALADARRRRMLDVIRDTPGVRKVGLPGHARLLPKPYALDDLLAAIREALDGRMRR